MRNVVCLLSICLIAGMFACSNQRREKELETRALVIHQKVLTLDTHTDTPMRLLNPEFDFAARHDPVQTGSRIDLPRMKEGGLDAVFFGVFTPQGSRTPEGYRKARERARLLLQAIHTTVQKYNSELELALTPEDAERIVGKGKRAVFIGMENGYPIGKDLSYLKKYYDLGVRYITLCHSRNNDICDSSTDSTEYNGLSPFGERAVQEMNRLGIMVDISHTSDSTFYDVLRISKAPVIASHSSVRALCDHPRNLSDQMIRDLAAQGGVVQICILSDYIKKPEPNPKREAAVRAFRQKYANFRQLSDAEKERARKEWRELNRKYPQKLASVQDVVDHIDHVVKLVGVDYVGIGTDFDGGGGVEGCLDVSQIKNITIELVRRGYTEDEIRKIWGGNLLRVFRKVRDVAHELQQKAKIGSAEYGNRYSGLLVLDQ